jgi:hypothetical protein
VPIAGAGAVVRAASVGAGEGAIAGAGVGGQMLPVIAGGGSSRFSMTSPIGS